MLTEADHAPHSRRRSPRPKRKTAGEIFCVLAHEVSRYREVPLAWAAVAALVLPPLLVLSGLHRLAMADIFSSWTDESLRAVEGLILRALTTYTLVQAGMFVCVALIVSLAGGAPGADAAVL